MSDSDDTDILLLIPPDFFVSSAEDKLRKQTFQQQQRHQLDYYCPQSKDNLNATISSALRDFDYDDCEPIQINLNSMETLQEVNTAAFDDMNMPPPTAAYTFLPARKRVELNDINVKLSSIEQEHLAASSDISTISNCTVRTHCANGYKPQREAHGLIHSTPKCDTVLVDTHKKGRVIDDGVLHEIDSFLDDRHYGSQWNPTSNGRHNSEDYSFCKEQATAAGRKQHASSLPCALNRLSLDTNFKDFAEQPRLQLPPEHSTDLISLSKIWCKNGQSTIANASATTASNPSILKEEQLRRQHLEKTIRTLQSRLLEYQQRLSVAIEVDRSKDAALATAQVESKSVNQEVHQLRESVFKLETVQQNSNRKQDSLQQELSQALNLAAKFQEKNEKLEHELATCSRATNECSSMFKKQLEELDMKVHSSKIAEEFATNELNKMRDKLAKAEYQNEKLKPRFDELEKENSTLRNQKELLQDYHQKQKNRADSLETQRKSLQDALGNLTETESTLKRKLDNQQKSLKSHYQQQLENVVAQKLKEFQGQLDKMEENLRAEARDRERLIAERAVKQLELINEKNELELNLMQEKHNEEVELYRIQMANASKKIDDLELKLNAYKSKRADIAKKLHGVMEAQWQKALEILTSPKPVLQNGILTDDESPPACSDWQGQDNCYNETPKTSKKPNLNNTIDVQPTLAPVDRLQAYIELLLSKSPSDFDKLDEILKLTKSKTTAGKLDKSLKRSNNGKPPWKA